MDFTVSAKMSFNFPLLVMLLLCLCVVNAQEGSYVCGRNGGVPCWKREQLKQGAIIEDTPEKFIRQLAKLSNKRSKDFAQVRRMLLGKKKLRNEKWHFLSVLQPE